MKAVRMVALGAALLVGGAVAASAQSPAPQQQGAPGQGRRPNMMMRDIDGTLTDAQKAKIAEIQKKYEPDMMSLRESMRNGGDRAEGMKKMQELNDKMRPEIRAVLTADQQVIFDKNLAEMKAMMEARQRQAPPAI